MDYLNFGKTGLKVSRICLGCMSYGVPERGPHPWTLNEELSRPFIKKSIEARHQFLRHRECLLRWNQRGIVGRALKDFAKRDEIVLATKVHGQMRKDSNGKGLSRKAIFTEIDHSLRRLGTDYVDLYQIHRGDYETPIEETLEALHDVVKAGKTRYIGASSMYAWQFAKALFLADLHGWTRFASMQNHYNLIYREEEREMMKLCADQHIAVIPWSPLARGRLTRSWDQQQSTERAGSDEFGKTLYKKTEDSDKIVVDRVGEIAAAKGVTRAQVALAWMLSKPFVTSPIIGATKQHHLDDAAGALSVKLTAEEIHRLEEPYVPHPISGFG